MGSLTTRALARFRCIGSACEDNCCHTWQVHLDEPSLVRLRRALDSPAERAELAAAVTVGAPGGKSHAAMNLRADGRCPFLADDHLCSVHARFGAAALPAVCASYPRVHATALGRAEVWGHLSCPELARLTLLADDGAALAEVGDGDDDGANDGDGDDDGELGGPAAEELAAAPAGAAPSPYESRCDDVRAFALELLGRRGFPMATRLFLLAYAGRKTAPFFHRRVTAVNPRELADVLGAILAPATMAGWHGQLATLAVPEAASADVVAELLRQRLASQGGSFARLVMGCVGAAGADAEVTVDVGALLAAHVERRRFWHDAHGARLDLYVENYAKLHWLRESYVGSPDLLAHTQALLVRIAALRFLLLAHPDLTSAAGLPSAARQEALDRVAVEVFYKFSRAIEHEGAFLAALAAQFPPGDPHNFARAIALARF